MAAGLGFKDFATGEVLTAADVDGYLMQGVWVFASATARDAAVTSPQEGNFAYLKDTNVTTYYTGSAWANLDTTGMTNPMTTTGDTIYSSSGSTPARLGIGTAGQVLQVNSGATAPEWATPAAGGGLTLLDTLSLSGSSVLSNTFSSAYKYLILYVTQVYGSTTNSLGLRLNADSGNNYAYQLFTDGGVDTATATNRIRIATMSTNSATLERTYAIVQLWRPSDTDVVYVNSTQTCRSSTNPEYQTSVGVYDNSAAITSVTILPGAGTMTAGTVYIYGGN
jgi:hypothetical protein